MASALDELNMKQYHDLRKIPPPPPMESISFITFCENKNHDMSNRIRLKYILPFSTCLKKGHCLQLI